MPKVSIQKKTLKIANLSCSHCDLSFRNRSKLNRHKREIHLQNFKIYECVPCNKVFKRKEHYNRHLKGTHLQDKYECPLCDTKYVEKNRVKAHLITCHDLNVCLGCCLFQSDLDAHDQLCDHNADSRVPEKEFQSAGHLYSCSDCKKCFLSSEEENEHLCLI